MVTIIILLILAGVTIATLTGDNGLLTKAGEAKNASEQANLEEEVQLAFIENQADKYFNSNSNIQDKLKSIFEKSYGQGNIEVNKSGKNYKVIVKDTKTRYRVRFDGKVEKYEEIDHATNVYAKLDDDGILYLRATPSNGYSSYENSSSIQQDWNSSRNASRSSVQKVIIEEPIAPSSCYEFFHEFSNLKKIENIELLHLEKTKSMNDMFSGSDQLQNLDLSNFNTSKVSTMVYLFSRCSSLKVVNLGKLFVINDSTNINNMFTKFDNIKIIAKSDTVNRLKAKFTDFTDNNFEIIE